MSVLNANMGPFNVYAESLKLHNLYPVAYTCICISLLSELWKCYTKLTQVFVFHFLICVRPTHNLCFCFIDE